MIKTISKQFINGAMKFVIHISYTDGSSTKRILNSATMLPESVVFTDKFGNKKED